MVKKKITKKTKSIKTKGRMPSKKNKESKIIKLKKLSISKGKKDKPKKAWQFWKK